MSWRAAYGRIVSTVALAAFRLLRRNIRVDIVNMPRSLDRTILVCWHQDLYMYLIAHLAREHWVQPRHVWLVHDDWITQPMHDMLLSLGVAKLVYGSAGHANARAGMDAVREHLARPAESWRTLINPDGPHGPHGVIKKGVFFVAAQSRAPLVAVRFRCSGEINLPRRVWWDRKRVPMFGARLVVEYAKPYHVPADYETRSYERHARAVSAFLNGESDTCKYKP